jgi:hypothetical protein
VASQSRARAKVCLPFSRSTVPTMSAIVTSASDARQAWSAAYMTRATPHARRHACGDAGSGPFWRISVQRKDGSSPSMARTTSRTVIRSAGRVSA